MPALPPSPSRRETLFALASLERVAAQPSHLFCPLLFCLLCSPSVALRFPGESQTLIHDVPKLQWTPISSTSHLLKVFC